MNNPITPNRPNNRPEVRSEAPRLTRKSMNHDDLYVSPDIIPQGMSYEWKRVGVLNKPETSYLSQLAENHWRPVPADRHANVAVEKDGLRLMERPAYLTAEAQKEYELEAYRAVGNKKAEMSHGDIGAFERSVSAGKGINGARTSHGVLPTD